MKICIEDQLRLADIAGKWTVLATAGASRYTIVGSRVYDGHFIIDWELSARGVLGEYTTGTRPSWDSIIYGMGGGVPDDYELDSLVRKLDDGAELNPRSVQPLMVTHHLTSEIRGPVIDSEKLSDSALRRVDDWLKANGCRWYVMRDQVLRIRGKHLQVDCLNIRNMRQVRTLWPRRTPSDWRIPVKRRTLRIRVPLATIRKA